MTRKLVVNDGRSERELLLAGTICVGRDPSCHIHDLDPLLSRRHAEFVWQKQHVTIRDLGSRNGILVNGVKVPEKVLVSGDVVQLGHLQLRYLEDQTIRTPEEHKRARERTDTQVETPTMLPGTRTAAKAETKAAPIPPLPGEMDATIAPGHIDLDATFAPNRLDPDATFAPGVGAAPARPAAPAAPPRDLDATFVPGMDPDATIAPAGLKASLDAARNPPPAVSGFDVTMAPATRAAAAPPRAANAGATIVVDGALVVTEASPACFELLGVRPDALVGSSAAEVVMQSLNAVAADHGPAALSVTITKSPTERTMTISFKAGQAVETVS